MLVRACLLLLAGLYAPQLSSFVAVTGVIVLAFCACRLRAALCIAIGAALFVNAAHGVIDARIAPEYVGDSIVTELSIADFPTTRRSTTSFVAEVPDSPWVPRRIRVSWFDAPTPLHYGEVWQLELRLRRPRGGSNPGGFDYETWLFRERIAATAYVVDGPRNRRVDAGDLNWLGRLRSRTVERIDAVVEEQRVAAVLAAISVGARHAVTRDQWQQFAVTGTSHLMAISGLHIGLAAAAGFLVMLGFAALLPRHLCGRQVAVVAAAVVALSYALVSGFAVPAQRATLMIMLGAAALLRRRELRGHVVVAASAAILAIVDPLATMAPGFQLSFAAVAALTWLARRRSGRLRLSAAQLQLFFALLPLTTLIFGRMSLAAPVVNLVAVPLFSFVTVPFTLAGMLGGDWMLRVAASSLVVLQHGLETVAELPLAALAVRELEGNARWLLLAPLLWLTLPRGWPGRSLAVLGVFALAVHEPARPPQACSDITVLDVGQGLSVVATTATTSLVYDAGPRYRNGSDAAEHVLLPYLHYRGLDDPDRLIVSHADLDHAGGGESLLESVPPLQVLVGEPVEFAPASRPCHAGEAWSADGVDFELLWPPAGGRIEGNDASCVLQVTAGRHIALIAGDIEAGPERELLRSGKLRDASVVVVPHHGSATSSTRAFVRALGPELAIVSAGYGNRWNLPDDAVVRRWREAGADVINTATSGAVSLRLCDHGGIVDLERERERRRRLWHE